MNYIAIVISGLALLAAASCLVLILNEKKRNQKRNTATAQYVEYALEQMRRDILAYEAKQEDRLTSEIKPLKKTLSDLEAGVTPDYEKAKAAAEAVNAFNAGISSILDFDPYAALKKERQRDIMGGEVE